MFHNIPCRWLRSIDESLDAAGRAGRFADVDAAQADVAGIGRGLCSEATLQDITDGTEGGCTEQQSGLEFNKQYNDVLQVDNLFVRWRSGQLLYKDWMHKCAFIHKVKSGLFQYFTRQSQVKWKSQISQSGCILH